MTITVGVNSFITESEFYSHLSTRLNADEFTYQAAVYQAGVTWPEAAQVFNDMRGATFAEIQAALTAANLNLDPASFEQSYNLLAAGKTSIQAKKCTGVDTGNRINQSI